jgi:hypothetical protein
MPRILAKKEQESGRSTLTPNRSMASEVKAWSLRAEDFPLRVGRYNRHA